MKLVRDPWQRDNKVCAAPLNQLPGHAPYHGAFFSFGDGSASLLMDEGHGLGPVIAHTGHQDSDNLAGGQAV